MWWQTLGVALGGLLLIWSVIVVLLLRARRGLRRRDVLAQAMRLVPDAVRLLRRLISDPAVPLRIRLMLALLLVYLISPIDIIPDVIPVVGYADDAIIVAVALRAAVRHAGHGVLARLWPGTPEGLDVLTRLAGLGEPGPQTRPR
ncbi:MAG: YkvA family protein [Pseudonocardia sp.]|jgi:uncharacterized membrane protein YkvA (DUF1232 family)